jgi:DNA-binding response OmpR family regulator
MGDSIRNVLAVAVPDEQYEALAPLMRRESFAVDRVPSMAGARTLIQAVAFDVLVVGFPLPGDTIGSLLDLIRAEGCPCRRSALLVLTPPERLHEVEALLDRGYGQALSTAASKAELKRAVSALLRVAPRLSVRLSIRIQVELEDGTTQTLCQTENVSSSGMLVRSHRLHPIDARVSFELFLPGDKTAIRGSGVIVRHTASGEVGDDGFAVRFGTFKRDGAERLEAFIESALERRSRTSLFPGIGG